MATVQGFSLRLSAQLIHGVTVVYNMQITYLYSMFNWCFIKTSFKPNKAEKNCVF